MKKKSKVGLSGVAVIIALFAGNKVISPEPTHFAIVEYTDASGIEGQRDTVGVHSYDECIAMLDQLKTNIVIDGGTIEQVDCLEAEEFKK